jgi:tryptophan synthase alpha subunit
LEYLTEEIPSIYFCYIQITLDEKNELFVTSTEKSGSYALFKNDLKIYHPWILNESNLKFGLAFILLPVVKGKRS